MARKYSKSASKDVKGAMRKRKRGTLRSGRSGKKVKSRKQAIAIGLSEARRKSSGPPEFVSEQSLIIFDVEGTLIDCVQPTIDSWQQVLAGQGHLFRYKDLHRYSGMDPKRMLKTLLPDATDADIKRLIKEQGQRYRVEHLSTVPAFPDVQQLFAGLSTHHRLALATSCDRDELEAYLDRLEIAPFVTAMVCGDDVDEGKPAPKLIERAKKGLDIEAGDCVRTVGDTPYDSRAARAAGAIPFGTEGGGFSKKQLLDAGFEGVAEKISEIGDLFDAAARIRQP
jgi:phosphoglycolate phosphatase-like HAD superfamily hydrolase